MAIHPSFPSFPYKELEPGFRCFPACEAMRDARYEGAKVAHMLEFGSFADVPRGWILKALRRIYADYPFRDEAFHKARLAGWGEYDGLIFDHLDTVGRSGFTSGAGGSLVGFCSWDPRRAPGLAIVGHNGLFPEFRGHGYGRLQIGHMVKLLAARGVARLLVTTGEEDFYLPARRMYEACGFIESGRGVKEGCGVIWYEREL